MNNEDTSNEDNMPTLQELVTQFSDLTFEEKLEKIREIRRKKYEFKPRQEKRKRKAKKKASEKARQMLDSLPDAQRRELLKALEKGQTESDGPIE